MFSALRTGWIRGFLVLLAWMVALSAGLPTAGQEDAAEIVDRAAETQLAEVAAEVEASEEADALAAAVEANANPVKLELWEAVVLGLVEGLTEYLPVSSTGHLLVTQELLGIGTNSEAAREAADAFAICIQAGAILAVLGIYWKRVKQGVIGLAGMLGLGHGDPIGARLGINLIVAFMPAAVLGLLLDDFISSKLFGLWPIIFAWFVGGVAILVVAFWSRPNPGGGASKAAASDGDGQPLESKLENSDVADKPSADPARTLDNMSWRMALAIGMIQCIAMWPGTSRSLVTIVGGVLVGLSLASAVEFSFLLGVITLCAATVYKALLDTTVIVVDGQAQEVMMIRSMAIQLGWPALIVGSVAAWISAVLAVKWMVDYLKKHGMSIFGYYRIAIAVGVAALILTEVITPSR